MWLQGVRIPSKRLKHRIAVLSEHLIYFLHHSNLAIFLSIEYKLSNLAS